MEGDTAKEVPKDVSTFKTTRLREEEQVLCSYTAIEVAIYTMATVHGQKKVFSQY